MKLHPGGSCRSDSPWQRLEKDSHLPEGQDKIRQAIRLGLIRVSPGADGRVVVIPLDVSSKMFKGIALGQEDQSGAIAEGPTFSCR